MIFFEDGEVVSKEYEKRGLRASSTSKNTKVNLTVMETTINFINERHWKKMSVTCSQILGKVLDVHGLKLYRKTIGRRIKFLGKTWSPVKPKRRTFGSHHHKVLCEYLIVLDSYIKYIAENNSVKYVFVFMDKSYIHQNHISKFIYQSAENKEKGSDRKGSKVCCLIIFHTSTEDGLLAEIDELGIPITRTVNWNGDIPHPVDPVEGEKITCGCL